MGFATSRPSLDGKHFDLVVVGGGINGVAIARECARAGQRVLIVEAHDFAAGTTSRSTRIIHGGLRYLEHGEIGLVRESLSERKRLLQTQNNLVRPLSFLLAVPAGQRGTRSALAVRFGLWLYSVMGGGRTRPFNTSDLAQLEHHLDHGDSWSLFDYEDAQCEFPERLVANWLSEALHRGAVARNYTEALRVSTSLGRISGVVLRDRFTGDEARVSAKWVVNAAGPWADAVCGASSIRTGSPMVGGIRGTHLVLRRNPLHLTSAVYIQASDKRPIFLVPWNRALLVGTTEVHDTGDPGLVQPSTSEIEYLLSTLQRFFPLANVDHSDVAYAFAGVRPLPFAPGAAPANISRRHILHDHKSQGAAGMISVIGGKLTTAASLARHCARKMGLRHPQPASLISEPLPDSAVGAALDFWSNTAAESSGISTNAARAIAEWYGPGAFDIVQMARRNSYLRSQIFEGAPHILAEVAYVVRNECAATLADILLRRIPIALSCDWSEEQTKSVAQSIAPLMRWTAIEQRAQIELFEKERAQFLKRPAPTADAELPAPQRAA